MTNDQIYCEMMTPKEKLNVINNLKQGDLVDIVWSGGNRGSYRVQKGMYNNNYAVNSLYYNDDGSEKEEYKEEVHSLRFYNPIDVILVWEINNKSNHSHNDLKKMQQDIESLANSMERLADIVGRQQKIIEKVIFDKDKK